MSVEEKRAMLGEYLWVDEAEINADELFIDARSEFPDSFSWHDAGGVDYLTSVKRQGACGSCWAFATLGAIEGSYNVVFMNPDLDLDLSEQQLVSGGFPCCGECGDCSSGYVHRALSFIDANGVIDEECMPYTAFDTSCVACIDFEERTHHIDGYFRLLPSKQESYKQAMLDHGPMAVGICASGMFLYYSGGVYCEPDGALGDGLNHAVVLVGWNDSEQAWIIKNSWRESWGLGGYTKIAYGNVEKGNYVFVVVIPPATGVDSSRPALVSMDPPRPNPFSGLTQIDLFLPRSVFVSLAIYDAAGRRVRTLFDGTAGQGRHRIVWDGLNDAHRKVSPGIYFSRLITGEDRLTRKVVVLR